MMPYHVLACNFILNERENMDTEFCRMWYICRHSPAGTEDNIKILIRLDECCTQDLKYVLPKHRQDMLPLCWICGQCNTS
jgi:MoaA/NifB/PqqE/SkfB family radical SAM enzyme